MRRPRGWCGLRPGPVLSSGNCDARHWAMAASSRCLARRASCRGPQPGRRRMRPAWVGSSDTPNTRWLAPATRRRAGCPRQTRRRRDPERAIRAAGGAVHRAILRRLRGLAAAQSRDTGGAGLADLLAYRAFGDAPGCGDVFLLPAFLDEFPSAAAVGFFSTGRRFNRVIAHGAKCDTVWTIVHLSAIAAWFARNPVRSPDGSRFAHCPQPGR